jgi:hypothetical protein
MPPHVERFVHALRPFFVIEVWSDGFLLIDCRRCDYRISLSFGQVIGDLALALVEHYGCLS